MRVFPRIGRPRLRVRARRARAPRRRLLTPARLPGALELALLAGALGFLLTGARADYLDWLHPRADAAVAAAVLLACGLLHLAVRRYVSPSIARRYAPRAYDDRRVLIDLSEAARAATDVGQLYTLIADTVAAAMRAANVTIFVRDDAAGDYVCRASSAWDGGQARRDAAGECPALAGDAFVVQRLRRLEAPLSIEPADLDAWVRAAEGGPAGVREARERECATLRRVGASLLVRVRMKEQLVGVLSLGHRGAGQEFSEKDKELLTTVAAQLALVIENSKLVGRVVEEERMRRELELAAEVQRRLFPGRAPASAAFELSGYCQPARGVGGDYYDFLIFEGGGLGVTVADVSGKGMSAAILMSTVQASLRTQAETARIEAQAEGSIAGLVSALNRLLCRSTGPASYVTFFYMQVDERTRQMSYVNAGHNPPLLIRAAASAATPPAHAAAGALLKSGAGGPDPAAAAAGPDAGAPALAGEGRHVRLRTGGPVIGLFEHFSYEEGRLQLRSGDVVVAYTDGLTESLDFREREFGEEGLCEVLGSVPHLTADEIRAEVVRRVRDWSAGAPQHDDMTFVVLKVK